jgi:hypothetical protein
VIAAASHRLKQKLAIAFGNGVAFGMVAALQSYFGIFNDGSERI